MKRFLILYFLTINFIFSENTNSFLNGNANFYYISKLEDQKIINLPYRMLNLSWGHQHDEFQLLSNFSLEYQPNINNYSFKMDDPQDFLIDLRELYITYLLSFGEIRIGKQIQTWGFVDENSPLDNTSAYDYNFLFESGTERKIGSNSLAMDIYLDNFKLGFTTTPFHSINRLPSSRAEFPIDLPVTPNDYQFMDIEKVNEYGVYLQYNSDLVDIATSYFSGYDRIYNLSGINIHETTGGEIYSEPDTVFAYRKTNVLGLSAQTFLGDLSVRMDLGLFNTKDQNRNVSRAHPNPPAYPFLKEELYRSTPIFEKSKYYQTTIQLEYPLPKGFDLFVQYFKYDTLSYNADSPLEEGESIDIPLFQQIDGFNPYTYFYPGMGSPLALMTRNAILLGVKKSLNERFLIQVRNLMDIEYKGYFLELVGDYKLSNKVSANFAINYINGDQEHPKSISNMGNDYDRALDYPLNQMEDFSHFRMQIKYSF
tara:strand:+ start:367 stop:1812 length:1446 start_codon:yes stop_codon:yes gene_type:complete